MGTVLKLLRTTFLHSKRRTFSVLATLTLMLSLPVTLTVIKQQQDLRQHATGGCHYVNGLCISYEGAASSDSISPVVAPNTSVTDGYTTWYGTGGSQVPLGSGPVLPAKNYVPPPAAAVPAPPGVDATKCPNPTFPYYYPDTGKCDVIPGAVSCGTTSCTTGSATPSCVTDGITQQKSCKAATVKYLCNGVESATPCTTTCGTVSCIAGSATPSCVTDGITQQKSCRAATVKYVCSGTVSTTQCAITCGTASCVVGSATPNCITDGITQQKSCRAATVQYVCSGTVSTTQCPVGALLRGAQCVIGSSDPTKMCRPGLLCQAGIALNATICEDPQPAGSNLPAVQPPDTGNTGSTNQTNIPAAITCDANGDGVVNMLDFGVWKAEAILRTDNTLKADCNKDGKVNILDFGVWKDIAILKIPHQF